MSANDLESGRNSNYVVSMKRARNSSAPPPGFTLIELLVVIAIIAILAAMLLPVLATAKDKGLRTTCIGNQKQLALAMQMYVNDNRDFMAFPNWDGGGGYANYGDVPGWLYTSGPGGIPDPGPGGAYQNDQLTAYKTGLWFGYMSNPKSYLCPVDIRSSTYLKPASQGGRNNRMSSYVMNGAVNGYGEGSSPPISCKLTSIWSTMCWLQWEPDENNLGPGNPGAFEFNDAANFPNDSEGIGRLHSKRGGSVVAIGGHVTFVSRETFRSDCDAPSGNGPGPGGKTYTHWSPFSGNGW